MLAILSQDVISVIRMLSTDDVHLEALNVIIEFNTKTQNICTFRGFPGK